LLCIIESLFDSMNGLKPEFLVKRVIFTVPSDPNLFIYLDPL